MAEECEIEGCEKQPQKYRRICSMHRTRYYQHGDVDYQRPSTLAMRLRCYVRPAGPDDCWPYIGTITSGGYGVITDREKVMMAHRAYYEMEVGPIPEGLWLDHMCHNAAALRGTCPGGPCEHRRCCNPAHLKPSTPKENTSRGQSPSVFLARLKRGVICPCGCEHVFDPTSAILVAYDQPD